MRLTNSHQPGWVESPSPAIKDSGARREFETGAVRDIAVGKGRCDLLPLDVVYKVIGEDDGSTLWHVGQYMDSGDTDCLLSAVQLFCIEQGMDIYTAMLELSIHFEDGCIKYGERNWESGIPLHCYIDSGVRHYLKHKRGDTDERHDRAFIWNMVCAIWTHENKPELIDIQGGGE